MNYTDIHCHYEDDRFEGDREQVMAALQDAAIVVDAACTVADGERVRAWAQAYPFFYFCAGIHPENAGQFSLQILPELRRLWEHPKCVGIGEVGLDYHWEQNPSRSVQKAALEVFLEESDRTGLPVVLHTRDAAGDMTDLLRSRKTVNGIMHCFSESTETARLLLDKGLYFSFGGTLTFKNAVRPVENAAYIPLERILLETDAPYLAPVPVRGTRNDSRNIPYVAQRLAEIKGLTTEQVLEATNRNAREIFYKIR